MFRFTPAGPSMYTANPELAMLDPAFATARRNMRGMYDMQNPALVVGRMQGYAAAMRDVQGAERFASFGELKRNGGDRMPARGGPEPLLRVRLEEPDCRGMTVSSDGTPITEDAYEKYLVHKAKHEEYSCLLAAGPDSKKQEKKKKEKKSKHSKHNRSSSSTNTNDSYTTSTSTSSSSSDDCHHRHHHKHRHHRRDSSRDLRLRALANAEWLRQQQMATQQAYYQQPAPVPAPAPVPMQMQQTPRGREYPATAEELDRRRQQEYFERERFDVYGRPQGYGGRMEEAYGMRMRRGYDEVPTEVWRERARYERDQRMDDRWR